MEIYTVANYISDNTTQSGSKECSTFLKTNRNVSLNEFTENSFSLSLYYAHTLTVIFTCQNFHFYCKPLPTTPASTRTLEWPPDKTPHRVAPGREMFLWMYYIATCHSWCLVQESCFRSFRFSDEIVYNFPLSWKISSMRKRFSFYFWLFRVGFINKCF